MRQRNFSFRYLFIIAAGVAVAFFLYVKLWQDKGNREAPIAQEHSIRIIPEPSNEDHILWQGSNDIVVVEYFDIDCKYCRGLLLKEDELSDSVKKKIRLIYRMFPLLDIYPHSLERAMIAECVASVSGESAFFDFLRAASRSYREQDDRNDWLMGIAKQSVSSGARLQDCTSQKLTLEKINRSRAGGYAAGIFSVPSFLVARAGTPVKRFDLLGPISGSRLLEKLANSE